MKQEIMLSYNHDDFVEEIYRANRLALWMLQILNTKQLSNAILSHNHEVEKIIATDAMWSTVYAYFILEKPFELGHNTILADELMWELYSIHMSWLGY